MTHQAPVTAYFDPEKEQDTKIVVDATRVDLGAILP